MKKLSLLIALFASPVFAQEEEQDIQIEIESGGTEVSVSSGGQSDNQVGMAVFPDKSMWTYASNGVITYCYINEDGNPRCVAVDIDD